MTLAPLLLAAASAGAQGGAIGAFALSSCSLRRVPATKFVPAYDEVAVETASLPFLIKPCPDAAGYRRTAESFRKPKEGQDPALLEPLSPDVTRLETLRCGSLEGAADDKFDFALAEYRDPVAGGLDRFVQIMRTAKRGARRKMVYFRRYPGEVDSRMAIKALCDYDRDGFPDVVVDACGKGGCGASALLLRPLTGELDEKTIFAPAGE